jgi:hypothetical protein
MIFDLKRRSQSSSNLREPSLREAEIRDGKQDIFLGTVFIEPLESSFEDQRKQSCQSHYINLKITWNPCMQQNKNFKI